MFPLNSRGLDAPSCPPGLSALCALLGRSPSRFVRFITPNGTPGLHVIRPAPPSPAAVGVLLGRLKPAGADFPADR